MKRSLSILLSWLLVLSIILPIPSVYAADIEEPAGQTVSSSVYDSVYRSVYDFSLTLGTLPTLYAGLQSFSSDNEFYMWYSRKATFDIDKMSNYVNMMVPEKGYGKEMIDAVTAEILNIYSTNPDAKFNLFVDDLRVHLYLQLFIANHIPESNVNVYLMSDGTGSYTIFHNYFNDSHYNWKYFGDLYEETVNRVKVEGQDAIPYHDDMNMHQTMYYASQKENVQYWLQFPELLKSNDPQITEEMKKMNTVKRLPYEMYSNLSEEKKAAFLDAVGVDKAYFDGLFYSSDKPNLIISGTSLGGERNSFEQVVKQIVADFGDTYKLFFKPHPAWDPKTNGELKALKRQEFLEGLGITILPAQLPMEALLWAYPDVKIGGYSSTLYMSTDREQTIFFIADSKESLVAPLPELYDMGHFGDAKFYKIDQTTDPDPTKDSVATLSSIQAVFGNSNIPLTVNENVYSATVGNSVNHLEFFISPTSDKATVTVEKDGAPVAVTKDGAVYQTDVVSLAVGKNKLTVHVVAENGTDSKTYSIEITRNAPIVGGGGGGGFVSSSNQSSSTVQPGISTNLPFGQEVLLYIPAGALEQAATFRIEKIVDSTPYVTSKEKLLSDIFEFTKSISGNFKKPVKLSIKFDSSKLHPNEVPAIFYYDEEKKIWVKIGGQVEEDKVVAEVDHFTKFAVFATEAETSKPELVLDDIAGHWAEEIIKSAISKGFVDGYSDRTFRPDRTINRAEFTKMLVEALEIESSEINLDFADRDQIADWAKPAISSAVKTGIIQGYEDGTFRPEAEITRAEMAVMIVRALKIAVEDNENTSFSDDANIPEWAKGYVAAAASEGIVEGRENNNFAPMQNATRAEAVAMILRSMN